MKHSMILAASLFLAGAALSGAKVPTLPWGQAPEAAPAGHESCTKIEPLSPFTHEATIPADADTASIRFAGIKLTHVATELEVSEDPGYCGKYPWAIREGPHFVPR